MLLLLRGTSSSSCGRSIRLLVLVLLLLWGICSRRRIRTGIRDPVSRVRCCGCCCCCYCFCGCVCRYGIRCGPAVFDKICLRAAAVATAAGVSNSSPSSSSSSSLNKFGSLRFKFLVEPGFFFFAFLFDRLYLSVFVTCSYRIYLYDISVTI